MISSVAVEEIDEILLPFRNLLEEQKTLRGLKGNFGIFRRKGLFRIMPIPHDVEHLAVVADTFHVKPLLKWLQHHNRFVWIDLRLPQWNVMVGDNYQTRSLPTMNFKANAGPLDRYEYERVVLDQVLELGELRNGGKDTVIFLTGDQDICSSVAKVLRRIGLSIRHLRNVDLTKSQSDVVAVIRAFLAKSSLQKFHRTMQDFEIAEIKHRLPLTVAQIAKMVSKNEVAKLLVADDVNLFGKFENQTGKVELRHRQRDHEDDDVLDDLAQRVILDGGEVVVLSREQIPGKQPIIALSKNDVAPTSKPPVTEAQLWRAG